VTPDADRRAVIRRVLDARFSLSALEAWKTDKPEWWGSATNDMGRGIYGEALREWQRLEAVSDDLLAAELAAIRR
jgi:hypothetical protein